MEMVHNPLRFRSLKKESGKTNRELATRLTDLAGKWLKKCDTLDKLKDAIVLEQLVNTLHTDVQVWVRERKPKTSQEAGQLADDSDYVQARKQTNESVDQPWSARKPGDKKSIRCYKCKKLGHIAKECRGSPEPPEDTDRTTTEARVAGSTMSGGVNDEKPKKSMSKDWSKSSVLTVIKRATTKVTARATRCSVERRHDRLHPGEEAGSAQARCNRGQ